MQESSNVFLAAIIAFTGSLLSTPFVIFLSQRFGLIDDPKKNRHPKVIHTYPVPRAGGLACFIGIIIASVLTLNIDSYLVAILIGGVSIVVLGILDDKININPYIRIIVLLLISAIPVASGIGIAYLTNPFGGIFDLSQPQLVLNFLGSPRSIWILADLFAILWIFFLMNILNMGAKGVDGQLPGVIAIAAIFIGILSLQFSADITQWPVITLAAITAGAYIGFLPWNFYPQKIMPGFSGSTLAGYLLGILSILSTTKVGTLFVILSIPIIDTLITMLRRVLSGKSPVWGDRGHLHHKLLDIGLSKRQVAFFYWGGTALFGIIALQLNATYKLYTIIGSVSIIAGLLYVLQKLSVKKVKRDKLS
jgi:UDP-GlcNAc:undecaprenyl-phosphate/decaprenyl-phosphate GlcNAc-1-phosphate transferase